MQSLQANYQQNFQQQQSVLTHLNGVLAPVIAAGPNQTGMSPAERAAENTQAINTTAASAANASRAVRSETAGRNDSGNLPQSGVDQSLEAGVASAAEGQLSAEQLGITQQDYALGRQQFQNAEAGELAISGQENPNATAQVANTANENAFGEANTIQQEENQEESDIAGGITSLAMAGVGGFGGAMETTPGGNSKGLQGFLQGFGGG
jgi:hypothetical protein